mmetsp:Transcript_1722/g.4841  ORF Transcript_1722/g.4841 Transcript_1722/m.4841 type:complete len:232 (+) Transcript_1722:300-995(+)
MLRVPQVAWSLTHISGTVGVLPWATCPPRSHANASTRNTGERIEVYAALASRVIDACSCRRDNPESLERASSGTAVACRVGAESFGDSSHLAMQPLGPHRLPTFCFPPTCRALNRPLLRSLSSSYSIRAASCSEPPITLPLSASCEERNVAFTASTLASRSACHTRASSCFALKRPSCSLTDAISCTALPCHCRRVSLIAASSLGSTSRAAHEKTSSCPAAWSRRPCSSPP